MNDKKKFDEIVGPQPRRVWVILATIGLLMIAAGTVMPILSARHTPFMMMSPTFKYIYAAGALLLVVARLFSPYRGTSIRVRRLYRIETWSAVFFCVGAFFLFYQPETTRDWLAFTLAGGAIQIYTSLMVPRAIKKELKDDK